MAIDVERRRPMLSTVTGGLSGPAVRPVAVRMGQPAAALCARPWQRTAPPTHPTHSPLPRCQAPRVSDISLWIQMCGPKPMMKAAAALAAAAGIEAEASLENMMACGLGACLCYNGAIPTPPPTSSTLPEGMPNPLPSAPITRRISPSAYSSRTGWPPSEKSRANRVGHIRLRT